LAPGTIFLRDTPSRYFFIPLSPFPEEKLHLALKCNVQEGYKVNNEKSIRPTKKQRELLEFIQAFILEHGYSPSYREIMNGKNYTSVATVALHVNSLIKRGHLRKRDRSARSLEVVNTEEIAPIKTNAVKPAEEKWLVEKIEYYFDNLENTGQFEAAKLDELYVLIGALKVLGLEGAAQSFIPRLSKLKEKVT
jgi:SOS-response transcriptional repressor LexA